MGSVRSWAARRLLQGARLLWPGRSEVYHYPEHLPPHTSVIFFDILPKKVRHE